MHGAADTEQPPDTRSAGLLALSLVLVALAAAGAVFVETGPSSWYGALHKAPWNPPDWVFGPVWSVLYLLMAIAAWLVARRGMTRPAVRRASIAYVAQLALNAAWTPIFFGAHAPGWALLDLSALLAVLALTIALFAPLSRVAAVLLVPYAGWVAYAWSLNAWVAAAN
jgi:tryptophan-rich sensory protein